ncbi:hypothetical protein [Actinomadura rugatobispora]|uniref:Uncharacterized protein n=1 Tax=Actinomadura rugatobispora TaxID=1994 RepID=A0ABW1AHT5_9ACTN|nr:hypothetical protein GCM10010200_085000 [Actinomadura rugatobispora]
MSESISFTVPDQTTSCFVIAADQAPGELPLPALRRLAAPFALEAIERLGTPQLAITSYPAAHSPWRLDHALVVGDEDDPGLEGLALDAAHHIGVTAALPSTDRPYGMRLARAVARCIAEYLAGVPVDLDTGQILSARSREPSSFRLADDWLGAWLPPYRDDGRCTTSDDEVDGCACVGLTTRGLTRFGLPELQMTQVSCPHDLAALNILRTTAQRLLPMANQPGGHTFPRVLSLTGGDFGGYWGVRDPIWADEPVPVQLTPSGPCLLGVGPPEDFPGTLNEWLWDDLPPVLYDLLSCGRDAVRSDAG